jgi:hypothetical protein
MEGRNPRQRKQAGGVARSSDVLGDFHRRT